jgi:hypothetical protein
VQSSKVLGEREFITEVYRKFPILIKFCDTVRQIEIKKPTLVITRTLPAFRNTTLGNKAG